MKLGAWLKSYRQQHSLSMQALADLCGFSKAYINILEKGINPKTNKPISPTMLTFEKIARGTKTDVDSLLKILDGDQPITITPLPKLQQNFEQMDAQQIMRTLENIQHALQVSDSIQQQYDSEDVELLHSSVETAARIARRLAGKKVR